MRLLKSLADLLRAGVLIGVVIAAVSGNIGESARLIVIFVVLLGLRLARLSAPIDVAVCATLPLATAASALQWYREFAWMDWIVHAANTGALAAATYVLLVRTSALSRVQRNSLFEVVLQAAMVGVFLGVLWEFYEWAVETFVDVRIMVGYGDTIADLAMDLAGSVVAGLAVWLLARKRTDVFTVSKA